MAWNQRPMLEAGARAPEFQLRGLEGEPRPGSELLAGGPLLLAFFKVSCPVCQFTFPFLERIYEGAGRDKATVRIVGVSQDKAAHTRDFAEEYGITFPMLLDPAGDGYPASNAFGIHTVPSLILIEPDGRVAAAGHGFSRKELEVLGHRMGVAPFRPAERVPETRPG